jgi:ubiquinone/menaquinone biosynthesis C-methylase UbiE
MKEIQQYYQNEIEKNRLELDHFKLEGLRTKAIISRYLNARGLAIADIGGGAGFYAFWLHSLGHHVSMIDFSPRNVALAQEYAMKQNLSLSFCEQGDARNLPFKNQQFDLVLLLGPLYHLVERAERVQSLKEAKRILKPGGVLIAAMISRYASLLDGFRRDLFRDEQFDGIVMNDLKTGVHRNTTGNPEYFTTAYFHTPQEIKDEVNESGLQLEKLIAVEGAGWLIDNISEKLDDHRWWNRASRILEQVESNDDLMAMSPHFIAIAKN